MKVNNTKHSTVHDGGKIVEFSLKTVDHNDICLVIKAVKCLEPLPSPNMSTLVTDLNTLKYSYTIVGAYSNATQCYSRHTFFVHHRTLTSP
jgi:hypothetical protein